MYAFEDEKKFQQILNQARETSAGK
jgi:hypothetical protein